MRARLQPFALDDRRSRERRATHNVGLFHRPLQIGRDVSIDPLGLERSHKPLRAGGIDIPDRDLCDRPNRTECTRSEACNATRTGNQKFRRIFPRQEIRTERGNADRPTRRDLIAVDQRQVLPGRAIAKQITREQPRQIPFSVLRKDRDDLDA